MKYILTLSISSKPEYFIKSLHLIMKDYLQKEIHNCSIENYSYIFYTDKNYDYVYSYISDILRINIKKIKTNYPEFTDWNLNFKLEEKFDFNNELFLESCDAY